MIVFIILYAALCLWKVQLKPSPECGYIKDYMSVDKTMSIK